MNSSPAVAGGPVIPGRSDGALHKNVYRDLSELHIGSQIHAELHIPQRTDYDLATVQPFLKTRSPL